MERIENLRRLRDSIEAMDQIHQVNILAILKENNVELTGKSVDVIDNIVTANGPAAAKGYAEKIVELLK